MLIKSGRTWVELDLKMILFYLNQTESVVSSLDLHSIESLQFAPREFEPVLDLTYGRVVVMVVAMVDVKPQCVIDHKFDSGKQIGLLFERNA